MLGMRCLGVGSSGQVGKRREKTLHRRAKKVQYKQIFPFCMLFLSREKHFWNIFLVFCCCFFSPCTLHCISEVEVFTFLLTCHSDCEGLFYSITVIVSLEEKMIFFIEAWSILRQNFPSVWFSWRIICRNIIEQRHSNSL